MDVKSSSRCDLSRVTATNLTGKGNKAKTPNPVRTLEVFDAIQNGLTSFIHFTQFHLQQCKKGERYLKCLEFELAKLEELKDQYEVHLKMREGVRSMSHAYTMSSGPERDSALASVRSGFKECTETLCFLESRLESMMGTFHLQMKGIQGFARLCPGDVFEITIKHGNSQKWKTRGKILKSGEQSWDHSSTILKALIEDKLTVKAVEVRGLRKNIILGVKTCETKDLFSASSQLMTINLNSVGTLKLNLIITWNPIESSTLTDSIGPNRGSTFSRTSSSSLLGSRSSLNFPSLFSSFSFSKSKLNPVLPPPRITEIIDADYYIHRTLSSRNAISSISTASSTSSSGSGGGVPGLRHSVSMTNGSNISEVHNHLTHHNNHNHHRPCGSTSPQEINSTSTSSSGSRGSSLHLTVTSGIGTESIPNSTLTSPETELPLDSIQPSNGHSNYHIINQDEPNYHTINLTTTNSLNNNYNNNNNVIQKNNHNNNIINSDHHHHHHQQQQQQKSPNQLMETINEPCSKSSSMSLSYSPSINNHCLKQTTEKLLKQMGKSSQEIIVEATVHQSSSLNNSISSPIVTSTPSASTTMKPASQSKSESVNLPFNHEKRLNPSSRGISYSSNSLHPSPPHHEGEVDDDEEDEGHPDQSLSSPTAQRHLISAHSLANVYFNISDILLNLISSLEDIQGQYLETHYLHQSVLELYRILRNISSLRGSVYSNMNNNNHHSSSDEGNRCFTGSTDWKYEKNHFNSANTHHIHSNSQSNVNSTPDRYKRLAASTSDISLTIEDALECFDFLNNAVSDSDPDSSPAASAVVTPKTRKYDHVRSAGAGGGLNKWKRKSASHQQNLLSTSISSPLLSRAKCSSTSVDAGINHLSNGEAGVCSSTPLTPSSSHRSTPNKSCCTPSSSSSNSTSRIPRPQSNHHHHRSRSRSSNRTNLSHSMSMMALSPSTSGSCDSTASPIDSPQPLSSGSEQLDICLMAHLNYCQRLVENLGTFGPLRLREKQLLEKISCQRMVIHRLACLTSNLCEYFVVSSRCLLRASLTDDEELQTEYQEQLKWLEAQYQSKQETELSILREDSRVRKLWDTICYQNFSLDSEEIGSMLLCVTSGQFAQTLETYMRAFLTPISSALGSSSSSSRHGTKLNRPTEGRLSSLSSSSLSSSNKNFSPPPLPMYRKVAQLITNRIIDSPAFEDDFVVSIFQVALFFRSQNCSLESLFKNSAEEIARFEAAQKSN